MKSVTIFLCGLLWLTLSGCSGMELNLSLPSLQKLTALTEKKPVWQSPMLQKHHLVGRIWRPEDGRFVDETALAEDLAGSAYVLLGEKHDNPDHHLLQARLIKTLTALGRRPAVVWEMIPEARQQVLNHYWATYSRDAAALGGTLGWAASGWPAWSLYQPIAEAAMAAHLPMYGGGLSKAAVRTLARGKPSFEFAKRRRALGLNDPFPEEMRRRSLEQLYQGHCELMPREALGPLLTVQQARDAVLAEHLLASSVDDGAVLIAGGGHVRKDFAVPLFLARHQPGVRITTVAFIEVRDGVLDPTDYAAGYSAPVLPFDYVWFTPQVDDQDHCAKLRQKWRKPGEAQTDTSGAPLDAPALAPAPAAPMSRPTPQPAPQPAPKAMPEATAEPPAPKMPEPKKPEPGAAEPKTKDPGVLKPTVPAKS